MIYPTVSPIWTSSKCFIFRRVEFYRLSCTYLLPDSEGSSALLRLFVNFTYVFDNDQHIIKILPSTF